MPGNLSAAAPSGVMPSTLFIAFTESRFYPMLANQYHDGTSERALIQDGVNPPASIRSWKLSKSLASTQFNALVAFFEGQDGGLEPFYFYNPFEVIPGHAIGSNFDATGVSTQGRHTGVFRNETWTQTTGVARTDASFEFAEIA